MTGLEKDWDEYLRRQRAAMADMEAQMAQWRGGLFAQIEAIEKQEAEERKTAERSGARGDEVPTDTPPAFRRVQRMVA